MKFAVVILACVAAASAQIRPYNKNYKPFANQYKPTPAPYRTYAPIAFPSSTAAPVPIYSRTPIPKYSPVPVPPARSQADARNAQIVKYGNEANPDGSYAYFFETDNGIAAQEQGTPRNFGGNPPVVPVVSQGSYSWTSPEGLPVSISYVADENGYQATGDAIPTSPPVPEPILRALAYIARNSPVQKK